MGPLYVLLGKCIFRSFAQFLIGFFVFLVLSHMSSLYILEIKPLSDVSLENMISHTVGSLFILMMVSCTMQRLFSMIQFHLFIFPFISLALGVTSAKILLRGISEILPPMFSTRTSVVSWLMFKSFIHVAFIRMSGLSWWSNFFATTF